MRQGKRVAEQLIWKKIRLFGSQVYGKPHLFEPDLLGYAPRKIGTWFAMEDYFLRAIVAKSKVMDEQPSL